MKRKIPKAISKRFKVTKNKKVIARKGGQDHFNARESGNITREKRNDIRVSEHHAKNIRKILSK